jgi:hypothetical protein
MPTPEHSGATLAGLDLDHFRARVLQDAITEATAQHWIQRAHQFQQAAPGEGDFHGAATTEELREAYRRCMATAQACLQRAEVLRGEPAEISPEVWDALGEVA